MFNIIILNYIKGSICLFTKIHSTEQDVKIIYLKTLDIQIVISNIVIFLTFYHLLGEKIGNFPHLNAC